MYSINYAANDEEQTKASPINTRVNTGVNNTKESVLISIYSTEISSYLRLLPEHLK